MELFKKNQDFRIFDNQVYNLSDLNWQDDTLETGIGDTDGSDPSMKGYNKGWQMDPYSQRYYASKENRILIDKRGVVMNRLKSAAKEVIDISFSAENYANEILSLWAEADGPLQNFYEAFTMNKIDNKTKKEIARILNENGHKVYPVLTDERPIYASDFREFQDLQLSDESLNAMENMLSGNADPFYQRRSQNSAPTLELGFDDTVQMNSDIGVPPNNYEVSASRLKKKTIIADNIESIPYSEIIDAISQASRNVSILLNRKLQIAPVFIKQIRKTTDTNAVPKDQNYYNNIDITNIITVYEIWKIFLDYEKTKMDNCYVVLSGDITLQGYRNGKWSNVQYCGFYSSPQEAENEISGYLE